MIQQIILSRDEVCDLIASVLQYNKKKAIEFRFDFLDGESLLRDFECRISCETEPIKVRVAPDDQDALTSAMDSAAKMIDQWQQRRKQTAQTVKS